MPNFVYQCSQCGREYERDDVRYLCPQCSRNFKPGEPLQGVLEAKFDIELIRLEFNRVHPDWFLFSAVEREYFPDFPVGGTPLFRAHRLEQLTGFSHLLIKNDGLNPTGSLKDRASLIMVAEANRLGIDKIVVASTGNAGVALAAICAAAGKQAVIFVPERAPTAKLAALLLHGAQVIRVKGSYDDAYRLSLEYSGVHGGLNRNTAYHPLTIEGKKSVALEIFKQNNNRAPDAVVVPVGDGVILAAVHKGFKDLRDVGLILKLPRLIAVQAETSDAIHHYFVTKKYRNAASPRTIADSISVSAPSNAHLAVRVIEESKGFSITVTDDEIRESQRLLAETTGVFAEPSAAATVAGLCKATPDQLAPTAAVVLLITGHGLKDIEASLSGVTIPEAVPPTIDNVP